MSGPKRYDWVIDAAPSPPIQNTGADAASGPVVGDGGSGEGKSEGASGAEAGGKWIYLRDGSTLSGLLEEEVGVVVGDEGWIEEEVRI